ncbi:hypothetical protein [Streptomyces oryzae]|uniref:hypothetical protein n=1 Tax=Streptomyces oryzae TaxID=1434886 RepID=UPI001FFE06D9|nr:hypothetical protein [Streptomyces oryzae]
METYLNLMLLRFGLLAGGFVVLALVVFAVALTLKRHGKLDQARRLTEPAARAAGRALARRLGDGPTRRLGDGPTRRPGDWPTPIRRWDGRR